MADRSCNKKSGPDLGQLLREEVGATLSGSEQDYSSTFRANGRLAPRNNPRPIPILDHVPRIEPDGGLIGCAASEEVVGTGDDFRLGS